MTVSPIPDGYTAVTPMVIVAGADRFLEFVAAAFGAEPHGAVFRMPDGTIAHSEVTIDGAVIMVADATEEYPATVSGSHLYVPDVDARFAAAVAAGATVKEEPTDQFYGDRSGSVIDPFGNLWSLAQHIEHITDEVMAERMKQMFGG